MKALLLSMLKLAASEVKAALDPQGGGEATTFHLREGLFVAKKE